MPTCKHGTKWEASCLHGFYSTMATLFICPAHVGCVELGVLLHLVLVSHWMVLIVDLLLYWSSFLGTFRVRSPFDHGSLFLISRMWESMWVIVEIFGVPQFLVLFWTHCGNRFNGNRRYINEFLQRNSVGPYEILWMDQTPAGVHG